MTAKEQHGLFNKNKQRKIKSHNSLWFKEVHFHILLISFLTQLPCGFSVMLELYKQKICSGIEVFSPICLQLLASGPASILKVLYFWPLGGGIGSPLTRGLFLIHAFHLFF